MKTFLSIAFAMAWNCCALFAQSSESSYASSTTSVSKAGSTNIWHNTSYVSTNNGNATFAGPIIQSEFSDYLFLTDFKFNIPAFAIIEGIQVNVHRISSTVNTILDNSIMIVQNNTIVGSDLKSPYFWQNSDEIAIYGNSTETWGLTWSPADILSNGFGVAISVENITGSPLYATAYIEYVEITVFYSSAPLPVTWQHVSVVQEQTKALISWSTASEQNNSHFEIERSQNGNSWTKIGTRAGAGNSQNTLTYTFTDERPLSGSSYYRIRQVDFDGENEYSRTVRLYLNKNDIKVYPTILSKSGNSNLKMDNLPEGEKQLILFNAQGQEVHLQNLTGNFYNEPLPFNLSPGIYNLQITTPVSNHIQRIVLVN